MAEIELKPGTEQNIGFIMATERLPGYEAIMGRWDEATHRAALAAPDKRYFIAEHGAEPVGFAILTGWASPDRVTLLKRIAVAIPGQGYGKLLLQKLIAAVFTETNAYRLWLDVFPENLRARHAYEAIGFVAEGVARGNVFFGGVQRDQVIMSIIRPDWEAASGSDSTPGTEKGFAQG